MCISDKEIQKPRWSMSFSSTFILPSEENIDISEFFIDRTAFWVTTKKKKRGGGGGIKMKQKRKEWVNEEVPNITSHKNLKNTEIPHHLQWYLQGWYLQGLWNHCKCSIAKLTSPGLLRIFKFMFLLSYLQLFHLWIKINSWKVSYYNWD